MNLISQQEQMQSKPKICQKSKALALVAEQKFFAQFQPSRPRTANEQRSCSYKDRRPAQQLVVPREACSSKCSPEPQNILKLTRCGPSKKAKAPARGKSIYHMSVLQRNQIWAARKQQKLDEKLCAKLDKEMEECTFAPVRYANAPQAYLKYSATQYSRAGRSPGTSVYSSPRSRDSPC